MIVGGEEEAWDVGEGFWKKKEKGMAVFQGYTKKYDLKHSSVSALGKRSISHTPEYISHIAMVRSWTSVL